MGKFLLADQRPGHFTALMTRRSINLVCPSLDDIFIEDIAKSLSQQCRFTGYTNRFYSVAEHLLLGLEYVPQGDRLEWFAHDFQEAYLGDVSGPLKRELQVYRDMEAVWMGAIAVRFGLHVTPPAIVQQVDQRMLVTEMRDLCGPQAIVGRQGDTFPGHHLACSAFVRSDRAGVPRDVREAGQLDTGGRSDEVL